MSKKYLVCSSLKVVLKSEISETCYTWALLHARQMDIKRDGQTDISDSRDLRDKKVIDQI